MIYLSFMDNEKQLHVKQYEKWSNMINELEMFSTVWNINNVHITEHRNYLTSEERSIIDDIVY